jgi:hypothetical protein
MEDGYRLSSIFNSRRIWSPLWLILGAIMLLPASIRAETHRIYLKTSPPLELLRPHHDPATLSILVTAADGRPVQQGWLEIALDAPKPSRWFSTDLPIVEGTRLLRMRLNLARGRADWKYLFPIRGEYRMTVDFVTPDGKQASQVFNFVIREHVKKWLFLALLTLGLFGLGFVAGWVFSARAPATKGLTTKCAAAFIGCLWVGSASFANETAPRQGGNIGRLEIEPAIVGRAAAVRWRLDGDAMAGDSRPLLSLSIIHLETGTTAFAIDKLPERGQFAMDFQFTDGADYRITAVADSPGGRSVRSEQIISVTAVEPPPYAVAPAMVLFLLAIIGGLIAGRYCGGRRSSHREGLKLNCRLRR